MENESWDKQSEMGAVYQVYGNLAWPCGVGKGSPENMCLSQNLESD